MLHPLERLGIDTLCPLCPLKSMAFPLALQTDQVDCRLCITLCPGHFDVASKWQAFDPLMMGHVILSIETFSFHILIWILFSILLSILILS